MIESSAEFIQALKSNARRLDAYFTFSNDQYHPLSFSIDNNIYSSDSDSFIGTFIARSGKLKVDPSDSLNLENQWVELYQGIMVSGTYQYKKIGSFLAYDKDANHEYSIIDKKALFNETAPVDEITYPTTPLQLAQWVCSKVGVPLLTTTFPNASLSIPEAISFGEQPVYADIIVAIAQASCTFARITTEDQLDFRWFSNTDFTIEQKNLAESWPETADPYGPVNSLVLAREPLNDNVYIQDEESIEENGLTELKIADNPILDIDRHTSKNAIFERIDGFTYTPVTCRSQGFFIIEPGDIIQVQLKDQTYVTMYVMNHSISYSGSSRSSFETPALTKSQIQYQYAESIRQALKRTEAIVDKQNQQIQLIIEKQEQQTDIVVGGTNLLLNSKLTENVYWWTTKAGELLPEVPDESEEGAETETEPEDIEPVDEPVTGTDSVPIVIYEDVNAAMISAETSSFIDQNVSERLITEDNEKRYAYGADVNLVDYVAGENSSVCLYVEGKYRDDNGDLQNIVVTTINGNPDITEVAGQGWIRLLWKVSLDHVPDGTDTETYLKVGIRGTDFTGNLYFKNLKFEKGNTPTDWSPAPQDYDAEMDEAIDEATASITDEYTSLINQTAEQLNLLIQQISQTATDLSTTIVTISNQLEITSEMAQFVKTTTEQLQSVVDGKVDEITIQEWARFDGATLELGTSDSPFKCRLSNTELAFYQGENKVAWISNNELHVLTAVIATSIGCGNFTFVDEGSWGFSLI